jgi:hypothetical protein
MNLAAPVVMDFPLDGVSVFGPHRIGVPEANSAWRRIQDIECLAGQDQAGTGMGKEGNPEVAAALAGRGGSWHGHSEPWGSGKAI